MNLQEIFELYSAEPPLAFECKDTSHGAEDFRRAVFASWKEQKLVIKIASNDFTTLHRVRCWRDTIDAYRAAGFYCPRIVDNRVGDCAAEVSFEGKPCIVFAEERSLYPTAEQIGERACRVNRWYVYHEDAIRYLGRIASMHLTTADFPSGICILETFSPSESCDEVWENALEFRGLLEQHQPALMERFDGIWARYVRNRDELAKVYDQLPVSVFQADMNHTNVLLDENLHFKGVLDFNLSGRDTVLNCLMRESLSDFDVVRCAALESAEASERALEGLCRNIRLMGETYTYSESEKKYAILLYRYLRPFWWQARITLQGCAENRQRVERILDWVEQEQTRKINFAAWMR